LVASLSHDINTPVASIKAVSEIMFLKSKNDNEKNQLQIINAKADQISGLITNIFNATLEELQELRVQTTEQSSNILVELIRNADYNSKVTLSLTEECLILVDSTRLSQVIDNVISNSYKYAGTSIHVSSHINNAYLEVIFKDFGLGISEDERPLIFNKYYRANNAMDKSGTGLGLYISKFLMNKMSGDIDCKNTSDGFIMVLKLRII
jgi:signal transduction histidine kinase